MGLRQWWRGRRDKKPSGEYRCHCGKVMVKQPPFVGDELWAAFVANLERGRLSCGHSEPNEPSE
jgi:hypothetical protein